MSSRPLSLDISRVCSAIQDAMADQLITEVNIWEQTHAPKLFEPFHTQYLTEACVRMIQLRGEGCQASSALTFFALFYAILTNTEPYLEQIKTLKLGSSQLASASSDTQVFVLIAELLALPESQEQPRSDLLGLLSRVSCFVEGFQKLSLIIRALRNVKNSP